MKISRRGKDLAVRLPASVVRELNLRAGDDVDVEFSRNAHSKLVGGVTKRLQSAEARPAGKS